MDALRCDRAACAPCCADYMQISHLVERLHHAFEDQPTLQDLAEEVGLSAFELQKLFKRWTGISPKTFLQAVTIDAARQRLVDGQSLLDTALDVGLSGPSRLHDLFLDIEGMTPGEFKSHARGLSLVYDWCESPFGMAVIVCRSAHSRQSYGLDTTRLMCLGFADPGGEEACLQDFLSRYQQAQFHKTEGLARQYVNTIFGDERHAHPLQITLIGTDFELRVWRALRRIPFGTITSYGDMSELIDQPNAARAVGRAVGRNPISFVIPCHRVVGKNMSLTGYHWGLTRKRVLLGFEASKSG